MKILPGNAQHIGRRQSQQDEFWFSDINDKNFVAHGGVLAIVADGMGGMERGCEASRLAARTFGQAYLNKDPSESIPAALGNALDEANKAVCALSRSVDESNNVGTTLVAAVIAGQSLHWISVGDSRMYLLRRGELTQFTEDHNYGGMLQRRVADGSLSADEADSDPDRNALTSFIGMTDLEVVDRSLNPYPLEPGDWILLCSDGLHGTLGEEEIAKQLTGIPQEAADELVRLALEKGNPYQDNVTVALLAYVPDGFKPVSRERQGRFWRQFYFWLIVLGIGLLLPAGWGLKQYFFPPPPALAERHPEAGDPDTNEVASVPANPEAQTGHSLGTTPKNGANPSPKTQPAKVEQHTIPAAKGQGKPKGTAKPNSKAAQAGPEKPKAKPEPAPSPSQDGN